jgi:hypothetical protein
MLTTQQQAIEILRGKILPHLGTSNTEIREVRELPTGWHCYFFPNPVPQPIFIGVTNCIIDKEYRFIYIIPPPQFLSIEEAIASYEQKRNSFWFRIKHIILNYLEHNIFY